MTKEIKINENQTLLTKKYGGLFCSVCEKSFMNSTSFSEHLESEEHRLKIGNNQPYKTITVEDIRTRILLLKEKKREEKMSQKDRDDLRKEWKESRKQRKKEWKEKQKHLEKRSRSNSRERNSFENNSNECSYENK